MKTRGKSIAISSAKGGVGKTLTTLNLAGIFEVLDKKVLIIDFGLSGGDMATYLNTPPTRNVYSLIDDFNNNRFKDIRSYVTTYSEHIDILASPKDPRQANKIEAKFVELILDKAVYNYDVVLIDTCHILNDLNVLTMDLVDNILLIASNDPLDLKNMRSFISILKDINFSNYKIILNESINPNRRYFSLYDIKSIIGTNVDYVISTAFHIKNIDSIVMSGKIITLDNKASSVFAKDYTTFMQIATDIFKEGD